MSENVTPLRIVDDGGAEGFGVSPVMRRAERPVDRQELLSVLTVGERMLVMAIVTSLEVLAPFVSVAGDSAKAVGMPLLRAFKDATGVDYVGSMWDE